MAGRFKKLLGAFNIKASKVRFPGHTMVWFDLNRADDATIREEIGDGTSSDVLMTPVRWLQRAIIESVFVAKDAKGEPLVGNELLNLLSKPNPFYSGATLLQGTVMSLALDGNAYWIVASSASGKPVEIWYAPHSSVEPVWPQSDSTKFITHYSYEVSGQKQKIAPAKSGPLSEGARQGLEDGLTIIHFREGVDPGNLRKGLSPLKGLLREIWTDNEAASFTAALLKNNGIPGVIISPSDSSQTMTPEEGAIAKAKMDLEFTRGNRGKPLVMLGPTSVQQFGFSPKELDLSPLRDVAEERVTAALGVPAAVVGFGSGLQQTKVGATMRELRQLAWTNGVIPLQRIISGELTNTLAEAFQANSVEFDNSKVEALSENQDAKANRVERLIRVGVMTRAEGRASLGLEVEPSDDVYLISLATLEVPRGKTLDAVASGKQIKAAHTHGVAEDRIIEAAPRRRPTRATALAARRLDIIRRNAGVSMVGPLERVFQDLGRSVSRATRLVLEEAEQRSDQGAAEFKADISAADRLIVEEILALTNTSGAQAALQVALEEGYLVVSAEVASSLGDALGVVFEIGDAAQQEVLRAGGLNAGLIDLDQQTRDAIFDALAEGRAQGLTSDNLARHISSNVEGGPWGNAATRARVIARTEGANAANVSTLQAARSMDDTQHVQVFDNRTGTDDPACVEADGRVITLAEAEAIGLAHPNCTRSFVPLNSLLMEELGL